MCWAFCVTGKHRSLAMALFISAWMIAQKASHKSLFLELVEVRYLAAGTLTELVGAKD